MATRLKTNSSIRDLVSPEEWAVRVDLAAAYRLAARHGWDDLIFTHFSARVPGPDDHFLLNPFGMMFHEVTASNLIKIDHAGNLVMDSEWECNPAAFVIHGVVHEHRADAHAVMHLHTTEGVGVSAQPDGLLPVGQTSATLVNRLAYHDYEGPSLYEDERERLVASLNGKHALILRNHGLLTTGRTVAECFIRLYRLESACQVQIDAAGAGKLNVIGENLAAKSGADVRRFTEGGGRTDREKAPGFGELEFAALMRKMDKLDPSYQH